MTSNLVTGSANVISRKQNLSMVSSLFLLLKKSAIARF